MRFMTLTHTALCSKALKTLKALHEAHQKYDKVNDYLRKEIGGDFCPTLLVNEQVEDQVVKLLDFILGDEIASYFMYECTPNSGSIKHNGKEWKIRTIDDVAKYVADNMNL
jgi:hypothetical protein